MPKRDKTAKAGRKNANSAKVATENFSVIQMQAQGQLKEMLIRREIKI